MSQFLDTVQREFNRMRARAFAPDGYEGVTHAGIAIVAEDSGLVLLAQRAFDETDDPEVRETWEFPGGGLEEGEEPWAAALREFAQEVGVPLSEGTVVNGWRAGPTDNYQGFVYAVPTAFDLSGFVPNAEVQAVAWVPPNPYKDIVLRPEMRDFDWTLVDVSRNEEDAMTASADAEPDLSMLDLMSGPLPIHGVLAPEDVPTGDKRGFKAGAMTRRDYRLPFSWQKADVGGHSGSVVTGSVDRLMRKDGLIHWEGSLMPSEEASEFAGLLAFFGRFGVSVDGENGHVDTEMSQATGVTWFDAVRAAGLTAVSIPAFAEAYVAFGPHPDMPDDSTLAASALVEAGDLVTFKRGPGWVTNPRETKRLHDYWTKKGQPGYAKIAWGTPGDFTRAKKLIGEKIGLNSPEDLKYLNQIIAQWHHDALGYWPGDLGKPGNAPDTPENRRRAAVHASIEKVEDTAETEGTEWELVLTSSAGVVARPPASYFDRHPDTGALVITEPDEFGIRRTYGYAGERGVCHIGYDGRCVELPYDPNDTFDEFHLGRTKTADEGYINTGLITYKVEHRDAQTLLTQTAQQAHFDNIEHAWAAVRLGTDENGVWFSGVVLPHVPESDIVLIEAAGQVSGEWKYGAIRGLQCVNIPGFPVMRSSAAYDDEGNVVALVAAAHHNALVASVNGTDESECAKAEAAERMAALRQIDAEVRMNRLKHQFNWVDVAEELVEEATEAGRVAPVGVRDDGAIVYEKDGEVPGDDTIAEPYPEGVA